MLSLQPTGTTTIKNDRNPTKPPTSPIYWTKSTEYAQLCAEYLKPRIKQIPRFELEKLHSRKPKSTDAVLGGEAFQKVTMTKISKLNWIESEEDRRQALAARQTYEASEEYHHLMAYYGLLDEIWLKQNPEDRRWTNDHQPSANEDYFGPGDVLFSRRPEM